MTELIPEAFREDIERLVAVADPRTKSGAAAKRLLDALPPKAPAFTDEQARAFYRAMYPNSGYVDDVASTNGHVYLNNLAAAGWVAPPALCPPAPTKAERHMAHYQWCNCVGSSATCCDPSCCPKPVVDLEAIKAKARDAANYRWLHTGGLDAVMSGDVFDAIEALYPQEATDG